MPKDFKRIISFAISDFSRNKGISIAAVFILTLTIMLVTGLFFFHIMTGYLTSQIQNKIDITAYFVSGTSEEEILAVKDQIIKLSPDIKNIEYISKDQALESFYEKHSEDVILTQALNEVGDNPFLPSLNIATNGDPEQYSKISNLLQNSEFSNLIDNVDYSQKKDIIEKVYSITSSINLVGIISGIILIIIAMLVVFNTVKLTIENSKEEISTMRVVGASDWFIRGPFMIQGIIYGIVSFLICILFSAIIVYLSSSQIETALPGFNIFNYFLSHLWIIALIQLIFGISVGVVSALIVVKRHLKV
jgi:cell division transport system permease protein